MSAKRYPMEPVTYQIRVLLRDSHPAIWRRILVRSDLTLRGLHQVLQTTMGWRNSHFHQFTFRGKYYGRPDPEGELKTIDDAKARIEDVVTGKGQCLKYEYDLGDSWEHFLTIEKVMPLDEDKPPALCLAGERACPPEDVGGTPGYEEFLEAVRHPNHKDHKDMIRWAGGAFDSEAFDLSQVSRQLQKTVRKPRGKAAA